MPSFITSYMGTTSPTPLSCICEVPPAHTASHGYDIYLDLCTIASGIWCGIVLVKAFLVEPFWFTLGCFHSIFTTLMAEVEALRLVLKVSFSLEELPFPKVESDIRDFPINSYLLSSPKDLFKYRRNQAVEVWWGVCQSLQSNYAISPWRMKRITKSVMKARNDLVEGIEFLDTQRYIAKYRKTETTIIIAESQNLGASSTSVEI